MVKRCVLLICLISFSMIFSFSMADAEIDFKDKVFLSNNEGYNFEKCLITRNDLGIAPDITLSYGSKINLGSFHSERIAAIGNINKLKHFNPEKPITWKKIIYIQTGFYYIVHPKNDKYYLVKVEQDSSMCINYTLKILWKEVTLNELGKQTF